MPDVSGDTSPELLKRRGRPRVLGSRSSVSTWIPATDHDALIRAAQQRGVSVSAVLRGLIRRQLSPKKPNS